MVGHLPVSAIIVTVMKRTPICTWCGGAIIPSSGRGRPRRYCRDSHRQRAYEARLAARSRNLSPDEVVITRHGWEAIRLALAQLKDVSADLAADLSAGRPPTGDYAHAVGGLSAAIAQLQEASEPRAAW